jgi:hypothetical protein
MNIIAYYNYVDAEGKHSTRWSTSNPTPYAAAAPTRVLRAAGSGTSRASRAYSAACPSCSRPTSDGHTVDVAETEKSADALAGLGLAATANIGGTAK